MRIPCTFLLDQCDGDHVGSRVCSPAGRQTCAPGSCIAFLDISSKNSFSTVVFPFLLYGALPDVFLCLIFPHEDDVRGGPRARTRS